MRVQKNWLILEREKVKWELLVEPANKPILAFKSNRWKNKIKEEPAARNCCCFHSSVSKKGKCFRGSEINATESECCLMSMSSSFSPFFLCLGISIPLLHLLTRPTDGSREWSKGRFLKSHCERLALNCKEGKYVVRMC